MIALWLALTCALAQEPPPPVGAKVAAPAVEEGDRAEEPDTNRAPLVVTDAHTAISASLVVQVTQRDTAGDALVARADELGGWFQSRTDDAVSLRVPAAAVDALIADATELGRVVDRQIVRQDRARELAELKGRLAAREEVLERFYEVLDEAGPDSVVAVEHQIVGAIGQIEQLKGRIRFLEDQVRWARVDVAFRFRDRAAPVRGGGSSFAWLDTLNVQEVVGGLLVHRPRWHTRGVAVPAPPDGFSAWRRAGRYRAASPDGVLFRVRTVEHEPEADLAFWKEAMAERMVAAGYRVVEEEEVRAGGTTGGLLTVSAPLGQEDWTYLVAFFLDGKRIVVVEAAGEAARFEPHRGAILGAISALEL